MNFPIFNIKELQGARFAPLLGTLTKIENLRNLANFGPKTKLIPKVGWLRSVNMQKLKKIGSAKKNQGTPEKRQYRVREYHAKNVNFDPSLLPAKNRYGHENALVRQSL